MRALMESKGLNAAAVSFAVGLSSHTVEKVLCGQASDGRHTTAVKKYLSVPNAVSVGGRVGIRSGGLAIGWNGANIELIRASTVRDAYIQRGSMVYAPELVEGLVYSDGTNLLLWAHDKWWQPTGGGVRIYETNATSFYEILHL